MCNTRIVTLARPEFWHFSPDGDCFKLSLRTAADAKTEVLGEKTCPCATLSTTNTTWTDPGSNPGLQGERPAANRLSHGTAYLKLLPPNFRIKPKLSLSIVTRPNCILEAHSSNSGNCHCHCLFPVSLDYCWGNCLKQTTISTSYDQTRHSFFSQFD
jgi:hypothetical protein